MSKSIAVVGASSNRSKFGNRAVRSYAICGWTVYPVHPTESSIEGLTAYRSVSDIPVERLDRISVYLPPSKSMPLIDGFAAKSGGDVWFNPGADSPEVLARARELGINAVAGCSVVALDPSPRDLD